MRRFRAKAIAFSGRGANDAVGVISDGATDFAYTLHQAIVGYGDALPDLLKDLLLRDVPAAVGGNMVASATNN